MTLTRCKSCGAEIAFVATEKGRLMPLDAKPQRFFRVQTTPDAEIAVSVEVYGSHWATCASAEQHRKAQP